MKIINRLNLRIYWRAFNPDDSVHIAGTYEGTVEPGSTVDQDMKQDKVQLEVKEASESVLAYSGKTIQAASKDKLFTNTRTVILSSRGWLVELTDELLGLMNPGGYFDAKSSSPTQTSIEFNRVIGIAAALVDGIIAGFARPSLIVGIAKATVGLASAIAGIFNTPSAPPSLQLADITGALQGVIDQNEARIAAANIYGACSWFDKYVKKSSSLQGGTPTSGFSIDLGAYDRQQFVAELNANLDGATPFLESINILMLERDIRVHVIPEYILGQNLRLNLERISLLLKQETEPLDVQDIDNLKGLVHGYRQTLCDAEDSFVEKRNEWFAKFPLLDNYEDDGGPRGIKSTWTPPQPEGVELGKGITVKYLKGDRWIIQNTITQLDKATEELNQLQIENR